MTRWLLKCCAALALVLSCSCPEAGQPAPSGRQTAPPTGAPTTALFAADGLLAGPGAPDRRSCSTDADCVVASIPSNRRVPTPAPQLLGCCRTNGLDPMSKAFSDWMSAFQARHCPQDRSACPALPPPAPPRPCMLDARCREGRCSNACGVP